MISKEPDVSDLIDQSKESLLNKNKRFYNRSARTLGQFHNAGRYCFTQLAAVVVGGKYLVRFEKNNYVINPFTFGTFLQEPETKRGISPLYSVLNLAHIQEDLLNKTVDMQS